MVFLLQNLGCAGILALVAFVDAMVLGAFDPKTPAISDRLGGATLVAAMVFVSAVVLIVRDQTRHLRWDKIRRRFEVRENESDEIFAESFDEDERAVALEVRRELAAFFRFDPRKLRRDDRLSDLRFEAYMPEVYFAIAWPILNRHRLAYGGPYPGRRPIETVAELVRDVISILEAAKPAREFVDPK